MVCGASGPVAGGGVGSLRGAACRVSSSRSLAAQVGVVQGSHLGLEIDDSTFRSAQDTFRRSKVCSRHFWVRLKCFTLSESVCESSIFQTLRNPAEEEIEPLESRHLERSQLQWRAPACSISRRHRDVFESDLGAFNVVSR